MSKVEGNTNIFFDVDDIGQWRVTNPKKLNKEQAKQLQRELDVNDDGIVGKDTITALQRRLGVDADGKWGNQSSRAWIDEYNDEAEERERYNIAKSKGKVNPAVIDIFAQEATKPIQTNEIEDEQEDEQQISKLPNIEVDNVDLAYLNKEIDKVKKQLEQRQSNYESVPYPKTQVGWSSYIANNDRGMLDKYQDAERAWYNKLKDQEHAKALADAQMEQQAAYRMDDNMKNRSKALNNLQYAKVALNNDTSNDPLIKAGLERDVRNAQEELKYWNKAVGIEEDDTHEEDDTPKEELSQDDSTTEVKIGDYAAITKINTQEEKDAILKEMELNPAIKKNNEFKDQYRRIKDIKPEDVKKAEYQKNLDTWYKEYKSLRAIQQVKWQKDNPKKYKALQDAKLVK